jgi:hypothetical protein
VRINSTNGNLGTTTFVFFLLVMLTSCNSTKQTSTVTDVKAPTLSGIGQDIITGKPTAYCTVKSEPDPDLLGHWVGSNKYATGAVWFGEKDGKYAFYYSFTDTKSGKKNAKWRPNIVDGNKIQNPEGVMKFWVKDGIFYSQYKNVEVTTYKRYMK